MKNILILILASLAVSCSSSSKKSVQQNVDELCRKGDAKSCVHVYRQMVQRGVTPESEQFLHGVCLMPRITCYQLRPTEIFPKVTSPSDELLFSQDIWSAGSLQRKQVIYFKTVDVAPST
jgi:pentatricopeptide repeat protein